MSKGQNSHKFHAFIRLIRPYQYIKNLLVFAPLFFVGHITDTELFINCVIAFVAFSFTSGAVYIFNDYRDIELDKLHPAKKNRPLASGAISKSTALIAMVILFAIGFSVMAYLSVAATLILAFYALMNIAYSMYLKKIPILDISIIAIGFVIRLFVGSEVTAVPLSMWIVIMTFLLALFIALAKRRDDVLIYLDTGKKMRKVADGYNLKFLDTAMAIMASVVIVAYIMYTISEEVVKRIHSEHLYLTSLFVILGIMRYLQITFVKLESANPVKIILQDRFIQLTVLGWILSFMWLIY